LSSQPTFAQAAPSSSSSDAQPLTFQDKMKLMKTRNEVFANNPDLKAEADSLKQQGQTIKGGNATPEQKMSFAQSMKEHQDKMKAAMLKIDPTLGPLIDQADAEMKQKMAARAAGN
jgi:hypothetical protein